MPIVALPDSSDIDRFREVVSATLQDTCIIQRKANVADGVGGYLHSWVDLATVSCRVSIAGERQVSSIAGKLQERIPWAFVVLGGVDITEDDRILYDGDVFEVLAVQANKTVQIQLTALAVRR